MISVTRSTPRATSSSIRSGALCVSPAQPPIQASQPCGLLVGWPAAQDGAASHVAEEGALAISQAASIMALAPLGQFEPVPGLAEFRGVIDHERLGWGLVFQCGSQVVEVEARAFQSAFDCANRREDLAIVI